MLTVEKEKFLNAIKAVKTSCGKANLQPILSTIHLKTENGGITLTATDMNNSARTVIEANTTEFIDICVNANNLENIVSRMNELVTLEVEEPMLLIKSDNKIFKLLYVQSNDFPQIKFDFENNNRFVLTADEFIQNVNQSIVATSNDTYGCLCGVCFTLNKENGYELASTDSNRLIVIKKQNPIDAEGQYVIPKKTLTDVAKVAADTVEINFVQQGITEKVIIKTNNCIFVSPLLDKKFPQYQKLIPQGYTKKALANKTDLVNVLETVSIMSDTITNVAVFDFVGDKLEVATKCENGEAKDVIDISFDNEIRLGFNYKYLLEGIKAFDAETLTFEMDDPTRPCLIKTENIFYIIVPVTLKK